MSDFNAILNNYLQATPVASMESEQPFVQDTPTNEDTMTDGAGVDGIAGDSIPVEIDINEDQTISDVEPIPEEEVAGVNTAVLVAEAREAREVVKTVQTEISEAEDAIASMESAYQILNRSLATGGLNQAEAALLHLTVSGSSKAITASKVLPSVESHGGTMSRRDATVASMEGIVDTIKELKQTVSAKIADWAKSVRNWWIKVNDYGTGLSKRATTLIAETTKLVDSYRPYAKQVGIKADGICVDNAHQGGAALVGHLDYMAKVADDFLAEAALERIHSESVTTLKRLTAVTEAEREWLFPRVDKVYKSLQPTQNKHILAKVKGSVFDPMATKTLLGDKAIVGFNLRRDANRALFDNMFTTEPDADNWIVFADANARFTYETQEIRYDSNGQPYVSSSLEEIDQTDANVVAATKPELVKILAKVKELCDSGLSYKQAWDKRNPAFAKFLTEAPAEAKAAIHQTGQEIDLNADELYRFEKKYTKLINRTAKAYWRDLMNANLAFIMHMYKVCEHTLRYCVLSLDNLEVY